MLAKSTKKTKTSSSLALLFLFDNDQAIKNLMIKYYLITSIDLKM